MSETDLYFSRLAAELDPNNAHQGTIIHHIRRYIARLQHDLAEQQLPVSERGKRKAPPG